MAAYPVFSSSSIRTYESKATRFFGIRDLQAKQKTELSRQCELLRAIKYELASEKIPLHLISAAFFQWVLVATRFVFGLFAIRETGLQKEGNLQSIMQSRIQQILVGIIIPQIIAFIFIAGRVISRLHVLGIWSWDDTLIVFAWIHSLAMTVLFGIGTLFGQGHHIDDVPINLLDASFQITFVTLIIYQFALCLTKISILVFYLRVFPARREKWMAWSTILCVVAYAIPMIVTDILQCNPVTKGNFFDGGVCFSPTPVLIASTVLHTVADAWMIAMVIPVVSALQIPSGQRSALMGVLSLGVFVILASIGRIVSIVKLGSNDYTYSIGDFDIWSVVEVTVGLICSCAPTIRPLLLKLFPKLMSSRSRSADARSGNGAIVLALRRRRKLVPDSPRADGSQKESVKFLESESGENLVAEPVRIAHSAHFPEGPGPLSRNATHDLEGREDTHTNADGVQMGRPF